MINQNIAENLKPCPFCGAGETMIDENWHSNVTMSGTRRMLISADVRHWCKPVEGQPRRRMITMSGRDVDSAIIAWDTRI